MFRVCVHGVLHVQAGHEKQQQVPIDEDMVQVVQAAPAFSAMNGAPDEVTLCCFQWSGCSHAFLVSTHVL